ncbi:MAG: hypothetical protein J6V72_05210 [Kiritimatiellae bacterium]|nr:hypothetical protein [Kiritimatiellia bacterium]
MAEAKQPSNWAWRAVPANGGSVSIRTTSTSQTFTAKAATGYVFDHWEFTPYSGSSSAPGQWMPALQQQLSQNLTTNPHTSSRFTYDPDENPEYNQAGILAIAHFNQSGPGPGPGPGPGEVTVEAFRFYPGVLTPYLSLNGTSGQFRVSKNIALDSSVSLDFVCTDPTVRFLGWVRLAAGESETAPGTLVTTNTHYDTTARSDGANRYRAEIQMATVYVQAYGRYSGAVSINGENDGTPYVIRNVPDGVPCTLTAERIFNDPTAGTVLFRGWYQTDAYGGNREQVTVDPTYEFTPSMSEAPDGYYFEAEYVGGSLLTVAADPEGRGSVSREPPPTDGDDYYADSVIRSGVKLTATPNIAGTFINWTRLIAGRDVVVSTSSVYTTTSAGEYTAHFDYTHKLVNSFSRSSPVQLVYDDVNGTDALVADY